MLKLLCFALLFSTVSPLELEVGGKVVDVEIARTPESQVRGLSGRDEVPEGTGMLFVYEKPQVCHFWMKDTRVPLSVGFFSADRTLLGWKDMDVPKPTARKLPTYTSPGPVLYALEVPKGWFQKHKIETGARFRLKNPSPDPLDPIK